MSALAVYEGTLVGELSEHDIQARVKVLKTIAGQYLELVATLNSGSGIRGDGGSLSFMPETWSPTVREFERLLGVMRDDRGSSLILVGPGEKVSVRKLRWHVMEWYVNARTSTKFVPLRTKEERKRALSQTLDAMPAYYREKARDEIGAGPWRDERGDLVSSRPVTRVFRAPGASVRLADAGLAWQATHWLPKHEPMLPSALQDVAP